MNHEQREKLFESASDIQKHLYESHESGSALEQIAIKHSLQNNHIDFSIAIGDVILGLVPQEKLPELLVERLKIDQPAAMRITSDVLDFLAPLDQSEEAETSTPVSINTDTESKTGSSLASEIAEAEAALQTLEPIKTMSHDMEVKRGATPEEPTHTAASQAELLDRTATVKDTNPNARWGTEQS